MVLKIRFRECGDKFIVSEEWDKKMKGLAHCFACNERKKKAYEVVK